MDAIRLRITVASLGAVALTATALVIGGGRTEMPGGDPAATGAEDMLVERVAALLETPAPAAQISPAPARAIVAELPPDDLEDTASAIAEATRLALAALDEAPRAADAAPHAAASTNASGFRRVEDTGAPAFVISAADAWIAAEQGWVAASGVAPMTIEPRPRARRD